MKPKEKKRIYRILANLYVMSRETAGFSHPYIQNELCLIGYEFTDEEWMPNREVLGKYIKKIREEKRLSTP